MRVIRILLLIISTIALTSCASRPVNDPITQVDPQSGYRPYLKIPKLQNNDPHTLFILSFSGGGTRAAALSYGVLEELRRTKIVHKGQHRRLVDEVDLITGVSGGSFTALAYALYGEQLFAEYEERFLKRNVQGALLWRSINPLNWWKFIGGSAGRSEIAAEYYDEILFKNAKFGDLIDLPGPFAVASGTDISTGSRFAFFQNEFDLLCSDLNTVNLSRAAAASSAVPVILSAITLNNYGGTCGYQYPPWVKNVTHPENRSRPALRQEKRYHEMQDFQNSKDRPFIHLVDGGVADNLGVRGILESLDAIGSSAEFRKQVSFNVVQRVILIVVNAHSAPSTDWDRQESPPGIFGQLLQSSSVPIDRYSFETIALINDHVEMLTTRRELMITRLRAAGATEMEAQAKIPLINLHVINLDFDMLHDPKDRSYFMNLPTSFVLAAEEVDRLRAVAGQLLSTSDEYKSLLLDLNRDL